MPQNPHRRTLFVGLATLSLSALIVAGCNSDRISNEPELRGAGPAATASHEHAVDTDINSEFTSRPTWIQDFSKLPDGPFRSPEWVFNLNPETPTYNDEVQAYTAAEKNVRIEDGKLVLEAHREHATYPGNSRQYEFTSGRVETKGTFNFTYGKLEATMALPKDQGTWPAFWLLSANQPHTKALNPTQEDWEKDRYYMHDGELDGIEGYGNAGTDSTVHTFERTDEKPLTGIDTTKPHTYGVELTPTKIIWTVDGKAHHTFNKPRKNASTDEWPFQKNPTTGEENQLYVILNLAMGGNGGKEIDPRIESARMTVISLKFYKYIGK